MQADIWPVQAIYQPAQFRVWHDSSLRKGRQMLTVQRFTALLALFCLTACVATEPRAAPPAHQPGGGHYATGGVIKVELVDVNGTRLSSNTHRCDVHVGIPNALGWQYAFGSFTPNRLTLQLSPRQWEIARSETRFAASFAITQAYARRFEEREFVIWFTPRVNYAEVLVQLPAWCRAPLYRRYNPYDGYHVDGKFPYEREGYRWY